MSQTHNTPSANVSAPTVGVLGGGGFGVALACAAARAGSKVVLHSRSAEPLAAAGVAGPDEDAKKRIYATRRLEDLAEPNLVFIAVPSDHVEALVTELGAHLDGRHLLVHVSRGLVGDELTPLTEVIRRATPVRRVGALAGPLSREALSLGTPGGAVVGTRFPGVAEAVRSSIASASLRVYTTTDEVGVQVASAMTGILLICAGIAQELKLGPAATAMVLTRGLNEATRLGEALGGSRETFYGLAGVGDAMTGLAQVEDSHGGSRPELDLGRRLALGGAPQPDQKISRGHIEAMRGAARIAAFSDRIGLDMPITAGVAEMLENGTGPEQVVRQLMNRPQIK